METNAEEDKLYTFQLYYTVFYLALLILCFELCHKLRGNVLIALSYRYKDGKPEFDFDADLEDIRLPEIHSEISEGKTKRGFSGHRRSDCIIPEMDYSLRVSEKKSVLLIWNVYFEMHFTCS